MKSGIDRRQFAAGLAILPLLPRLEAAGTGLRVASIDWALTESMLALGHQPIAVVAASDWNKFPAGPPLPAGVADLGLQSEINFELLASLKPDLILTSPFAQQLDPILKKIAEVLPLSVFEKGAVPLEHQRAILRILGERLGRVAEARKYLADAELAFDRYRTGVSAFNRMPILLVNFIDARHARVYGGSGLYQNVLDRIGLVNAWTGQTNYWGYSTVGIEKLASEKQVRMIAFNQSLPTHAPRFSAALSGPGFHLWSLDR